MPLQLLWFASVIGSVALAAASAARWRDSAALVAGFLAGAYVFRGGQIPTPALAGTLAAFAAGCQLFRPAWKVASAGAAGILAAVSAAIFEYGLGRPIAMLAGAAPAALSFYWARRNPRFAPAAMREEALLLVMLVGLTAAATPSVLEGWRSASALSHFAAGEVERMLPLWVLLLSATSVVLGGAWSLWRRG